MYFQYILCPIIYYNISAQSVHVYGPMNRKKVDEDNAGRKKSAKAAAALKSEEMDL